MKTAVSNEYINTQRNAYGHSPKYTGESRNNYPKSSFQGLEFATIRGHTWFNFDVILIFSMPERIQHLRNQNFSYPIRDLHALWEINIFIYEIALKEKLKQ